MNSRQTSPASSSNGRGLAGSIESLADGAERAVHQMRERVEPNAVRWAQQAEDLAQRSLSAVRERSDRLRERAVTLTDRSLNYVQAEPVKAVLIAAAAGALLMALLGSRSRRED